MRYGWIAAGMLLLSATGASADPRDDVISTMVKCADLADKDARVACFDKATPELRAVAAMPPPAPVVAEAPADQAAAAAAAAEPAPEPESGIARFFDPFGSADSRPTAAQMAYQPMGQEILPITIGIADYSVTPGGFTVTLDNGQVWQSRPGHFDSPQFKVGEKNFVVIAHGLIGGYDLSLRGNGKIYKVMRIK